MSLAFWLHSSMQSGYYWRQQYWMIQSQETDSHVDLLEGPSWVHFSTVTVLWFSVVAALPAHIVFGSGGTRGWMRARERKSCIALCSAVHFRSVSAWGLVYCRKSLSERGFFWNAQGQILACVSRGLPTSVSLFNSDYKVRLVSVTCLNDKYICKTDKYLIMFSLHQSSALFLILTYFFLHLFLFLQCLFFCYCNHTAKISMLSAREWKPRFQEMSFSATMFQCCGLCQGWWGGEARSRGPRGKGVCFPVVHVQRQDVALFSLCSSWQ